MTEWDKWSLLGYASGVAAQHGAGLTPLPLPDEAIVTIMAEDGPRASAIISRSALPAALLADLEAGLVENRAHWAEHRSRLAAERLSEENGLSARQENLLPFGWPEHIL